MSEPVRRLTREQALALDGPAVVLTDGYDTLFAAAIRRVQFSRATPKHRTGYYNHSMMLASPGRIVSQDTSGLATRLLADYLRGRHRVKFWRNTSWTDNDRSAMARLIRVSLADAPRYDWLGVLGQLFGLRWLHRPGKFYCSEWTSGIIGAVKVSDKWALGDHPTPGEQDAYFKSALEWVCDGVYDPYEE